MKLFYILMLTALLGLFGVGCDEGVDSGTPAPKTEKNSFIVYSQLLKAVTVKSGDLSTELSTGDCIAVPEDKMAGLEINDGSMLCGGEGGTPCELKHVKITRNEDNSASVLVDSNVFGCTSVLEAKAEEEENENDRAKDDETEVKKTT